MKSCSDDVCHDGTDEHSAHFHRGRRTVSRGLLRTNQQSSLRDNPPSVSGETTSPIPPNQLSLRKGENGPISDDVLHMKTKAHLVFAHNIGGYLVCCLNLNEIIMLNGGSTTRIGRRLLVRLTYESLHHILPYEALSL
ncbi:unnamed protein product [Protopolystoma xenopodis]|uniref:Uncharacterized protein n=1 Tax=Protopolystoma xenopodis TaxID=117903 RepID=A0A3S5BTG6_9PLAT|nr:unnamed protein product [Protopolystoma xenopodis]